MYINTYQLPIIMSVIYTNNVIELGVLIKQILTSITHDILISEYIRHRYA